MVVYHNPCAGEFRFRFHLHIFVCVKKLEEKIFCRAIQPKVMSVLGSYLKTIMYIMYVHLICIWLM